MAEVVSKKSRKRRHNSQGDDNNDLPAKVQKVSAGKKAPSMEVEEASPPLSEPDSVKGKGVKRFRFPKRPVNKSWLSHIAANIASKLVSSAIAKKIDPRQNHEDIEDSFILSQQDLAKFWFYLEKEYPPSRSLDDILTDLSPLVKVSTTEILKQEMKLKYKDQLPKQPATAYVQFVNSKRSKMMEKHPKIGQVDVTRILAQKWREIGPDRKEKYVQRYETMKKQYKEEMEEFYSEHPDARPSPKLKTNSRKETTSKRTLKTTQVADNNGDSTEQRINELKKLAPKPPVTGYFLFVNAKRSRYKDKHPDLKPAEIAKNLAEKWHAMSSERQGKYKKVYENNFKEYKVKLEEFHERYPDAKELLKRGSRTKRKPTAASVTSSTTTTVAAATSSTTKSGLTSPTSKTKSDLSSPTSKSKSGLSSPTSTTTNSHQNHKTKQDEESDNEESDSGSSSNSDESDSEEEEEAPTTKPQAVITTSKAPASKVPVARKEIRTVKQESGDSESSNDSGSSDEDSQDSSSDSDSN